MIFLAYFAVFGLVCVEGTGLKVAGDRRI